MRLSLLFASLLLAATPLAAQATRADTAAIVRAATDGGWHLVATRELKIVGDTATLVVEQQKAMAFGAVPARDSQPAELVRSPRRVERRNGKWVRRSS